MARRHARLPAQVLFGLGLYDLVRGVMHTLLLRWSGIHIAGFDPVNTPIDQFFMLGAFGISNLLTGCLFLLGLAGIRASGIQGTLAYSGQYLMTIYFAVCIGTVLLDLVDRRS